VAGAPAGSAQQFASHEQQLATQLMADMTAINNSYVNPMHATAAERFAQSQQDVRDYKRLMVQGQGTQASRPYGNPAAAGSPDAA
jgi:hypothetical protein